MKSIQHQYSTKALGCIHEVQQLSKKEQQQYGSLCHRVPSMIMLNGLRLTVAFLSVKKGMRQHFLKDMGLALGIEIEVRKGKDTVPERMDDYRLLTSQVLAASVWFKRYAEAILGVTQADADGQLEEQS
ncbi:type III-B CRISPR module-associated protein Cmr5 [Paenibacillus sp. NPDC057934]|uniref:type III-B CRISPR module-associated protein Cmr5 n=1 Tax=Paenibacillus sp. NPDC057934 TaxID=3346282 RepID=UPI0036DF34D3